MNYEDTYPYDESVTEDNFYQNIKVKRRFAVIRILTIAGLALLGAAKADPSYVIAIMILALFAYEFAYFSRLKLQSYRDTQKEKRRLLKDYYHYIDNPPRCIPRKYYQHAKLLFNALCCKKPDYNEKNVHAFPLDIALEILDKFRTGQDVFVAEMLVTNSEGCVTSRVEYLSQSEYTNHQRWDTPASIDKNLSDAVDWLSQYKNNDSIHVIFNALLFEKD